MSDLLSSRHVSSGSHGWQAACPTECPDELGGQSLVPARVVLQAYMVVGSLDLQSLHLLQLQQSARMVIIILTIFGSNESLQFLISKEQCYLFNFLQLLFLCKKFTIIHKYKKCLYAMLH